MCDVKQLRPDWMIARALSHECGLAVARDWMRAPFVDLRGHVVDMDLLGPQGTDVRLGAKLLKDRDVRDKVDWECLPWLDAVYFGDFGEHRFAVRITECTAGGQLEIPVGGLNCFYAPDYKQRNVTHVCTLYVEHSGSWDRSSIVMVDAGLTPPRGVVTYLSDDVMSFVAYESKERVNLFVDESLRVTMTLASLCVAFIQECDEHFVEVRPEPKPRTPAKKRKAAKTEQKFPWLKDNSPRIIVLDPRKQYSAHGREGLGGTHASPTPHQRRGHVRTYRHERFKNVRGKTKRVKAAWIGPREWVHRGNVYRVADVEGQEA